MENVIEIFNLRKVYKTKVALDDVTLNIKKGEILGLVGKNGAGKTTLIRCLTGVANLTSGSFKINGVESTDKVGMKEQKRKMAAMIEAPALYLNASAKFNLISRGILLGLEGDLNAFAEEQLRFVGLEEVINSNRAAKDFSLGMRQRLGIAMALIGDPEVLILDEPTNGLDPEGIVEIRNLLLKLNKEKNTTILISSHILGELSKLASSYVFIDQGKIIKQLEGDDIEHAMKARFVLRCSDQEKAISILEKKGINFGKSAHHISLFDIEDAGPIITMLVKEGIEIITIKEEKSDLEDFYMSLLGGEQ